MRTEAPAHSQTTPAQHTSSPHPRASPALARPQRQQQQPAVHGRSPHAPVAAAIRHDYWRITAPDGRVLGNVEQLDTADAAGDTCFVARRFHVASTTYLPLGRFRSMDDAVDAFRS